MRRIAIFLIMLIMINITSIAIESNVQSQDNIYLDISKSELKIDEEFSFTINLANIGISAFDLNIYFNENLFQYVSGPENTNIVNGKIITSWYDETGGNNAKQNCELVKYTLKAKEIGNELISIQGEFYDSEGILVQSFTDGIEVITEEEGKIEKIEISETSQTTDDNSKLEIMRLNQEGITPVFSPDITEYYFLTKDLNSLEIIAIPQNSNSEVIVTGNTNFKEGLNTININITSPDKTSITNYKIYVTKTNNLEQANANLEILAIENATLEPEFVNDIYEYNTIVTNTTEKLNILAIPEKQSANVQISGGSNLVYGNNEILINVIAENGYTKKEYKVNAYRRNEEEQKLADEQKEIEIQKLNAILESQNEENLEKSENNESIQSNIVENIKENKWKIVVAIIIVIAILSIVIYRIKSYNSHITK